MAALGLKVGWWRSMLLEAVGIVVLVFGAESDAFTLARPAGEDGCAVVVPLEAMDTSATWPTLVREGMEDDEPVAFDALEDARAAWPADAADLVGVEEWLSRRLVWPKEAIARDRVRRGVPWRGGDERERSAL